MTGCFSSEKLKLHCGLCAGGRQHQQVSADPWKGHLSAVRTGPDPEAGLHPLQGVSPHVVRTDALMTVILSFVTLVCKALAVVWYK